MKTVLVLLMTVLIGFGFLLSDGIHTREDLSRFEQLYAQSTRESESLRARLSESERLRQELTLKLAVQEGVNRQLSQENAALRIHMAELQRSVESLQMLIGTPTTLPDAGSFLVFLPLIPASIAVTYLLVRFNKKHPQWKATKGKDPRGTYVQLSERELEELIQKRRSQR
jgi:hypothetical protein